MRRLLFMAVLVLTTPVFAQPVKVIDNTDCVAVNDPYPCCQDFEIGLCNNKAAWEAVKFNHQYTEVCASFWYKDDCGSDRLGTDWLVAVGSCTQQEANDGDSLPIVNCTETRSENGWCRSNLGCTELKKPWGCCTGLDTGTCPFTGSLNAPQPAACRKAWSSEIVRIWKALRQSGQRQWKAQDTPKFVVDDNPVD